MYSDEDDDVAAFLLADLLESLPSGLLLPLEAVGTASCCIGGVVVEHMYLGVSPNARLPLWLILQ
jgi:hypothetical protein